jgi:hypothetical protein
LPVAQSASRLARPAQAQNAHTQVFCPSDDGFKAFFSPLNNDAERMQRDP